MRIATRPLALTALGVSAVLSGAAIIGLGTDQWISSGFLTSGPVARAEIWNAVGAARGDVKPVVATEAEWLNSRTDGAKLGGATRLQAATATGVTLGLSRLDLGPLEVIDVKALPDGLNLGAHGESSGAKVMISAREPGSGRIVRVIVDAATAVAPSQTGKHNGL